MSRPDLLLLHVSDCHLGSTDGITAKEQAFEAMIDLAVAKNVDAVLIAGDLFDSARPADSVIEWTVQRLDSLHCPVVILPGNHDWFEDQSPFLRVDFELRCPHVHVLDKAEGEVLILDDLDIGFFGRPVLDHSPSFRPVADLPVRPDVSWAVVMGHGLVLESDHPTSRGSPIYPRDLAAVDWDYVALGHWSRYWRVQDEPPVVYAGDTVASADGRPGVVLVSLAGDGVVTPTWTPLAGR